MIFVPCVFASLMMREYTLLSMQIQSSEPSCSIARDMVAKSMLKSMVTLSSGSTTLTA
jgi:hypothetical protein